MIVEGSEFREGWRSKLEKLSLCIGVSGGPLANGLYDPGASVPAVVCGRYGLGDMSVRYWLAQRYSWAVPRYLAVKALATGRASST